MALYRRVHEALRRAIAEGGWAPGDSLPSEASLGARFGVSRITVRQAMQLLQELQTFWMRVMGGVPGGVTTDEKPNNISLDV